MLSNKEDLPPGPGTYAFKWACDRKGYCKPWGTRDERRALKTKTLVESYEVRTIAADYNLKNNMTSW